MTDEELIKRFDLAAALYMFCSNYHSGQWSRGYRILSKLSRVYKPGLTIQNGEFENEEQQEIYDHLVKHYAGLV